MGDTTHVERVELPLSFREVWDLYDRLGLSEDPDEFGVVNSEYLILSWDISDITDYSLEELFPHLDISEYELDECNAISDKFDEVHDDYGFELFLAAVEAGRADHSIEGLMAMNFEEYSLYEGIENEEQLGRYMYDEYGMEEFMEDYIDYAALGEDELRDFDIEEYLAGEGYDLDDPDDLARCLEDYDVDFIDAIDYLDCVGFDSYEDYGKEVYSWGGLSGSDLEPYIDFDGIGEYFYYDGDFTSYGWLRHY